MTDIEKEEQQRKETCYINKHEVLHEIKEVFNKYGNLHNRPEHEQTLLGNFITIVESDLKHSIKQLKEKQI